MTNDFVHSEKVAIAALAEMRTRKIPMTPENFNIWYEYCNGANSGLAEAVKPLVEDDVEFTDAKNASLYSEHFGIKKNSRDLHEVGGQIQNVTEQVVAQLKGATDITADYRKTLEDFSEELANAADNISNPLNGTIRSVMQETQKVAQRNKDLEARLNSSADEIDGLHDDLIKARQEAMTDGLTGLANRKCFDKRLLEGMSSSAETGEALSLMLMDIDYFKKFNDTYGHQIGDQVLRLVAQNLGRTLKGQDTAARYGGEEFAVILPNTPLDIAVKLAENIRINLANQVLKSLRTGDSFGKLTVSIGVAKYHEGEPAEDLIRRSDKALYRAKQDGRNRVVGEDDGRGKTNLNAV